MKQVQLSRKKTILTKWQRPTAPSPTSQEANKITPQMGEFFVIIGTYA
jgi:hypothetical protein